MAFDQSTRNRLQKFVSDARKLLSEEFTKQMQNTYGLDPNTGVVANLNELPGLTPSQRQTSTLLRDTLDHYLAASHKTAPYQDKSLVIATLDRIVREQAFTVLNRLAALRMAESRNFVMESISQGYQSKGFQLYQRIAGSSLGETGQAYQVYLFSIFDELSLDLAVLFDRYSSQGRLFPNESILNELLELINNPELELLWGEDETVGWIFQYWNVREEIDLARGESRAPRNSREMAVRNQFFTPRYVVEFLTDNTIGKTWYEMLHGQTNITDKCDYLVTDESAVFLSENESITEEQAVSSTQYIPFREAKDPRCLRIIDPACGSGHFLLYVFDILIAIYEEAWEREPDIGWPIRDNYEPLRETYASFDDFKRDIPALIISNNLFGIDIDVRAVQIAGLAVWLRGQRYWNEKAVIPNKRPQVTHSNLVCAEPLSFEAEQLSSFQASMESSKSQLYIAILNIVSEKTALAGEMGILLKLEKDIETALKDSDLLTENDLNDGLNSQVFNETEDKLLEKLTKFISESASNSAYKSKLFSQDIYHSLAFIDVMKLRFDAILMNPPFGKPSVNSEPYMEENYPDNPSDVYQAFVDRGQELLVPGGFLGSISSRTGFFLGTYENWRNRVVLKRFRPLLLADLGMGVLDAMVETAAYVFRSITQGEEKINLNQCLIELEDVEASKRDEFSVPKYQKCRTEKLSREQAIYELRSHTEAGFINRVEGSTLKYQLIPSEIKLELQRIKPVTQYPQLKCIRLLDIENKQLGLKSAIDEKTLLETDPSSFDAIPGSPFSYWVSGKLRKVFQKFPPFKNESRSARQGLASGDDFRFARLWWEVCNKRIAKPVSHSNSGDGAYCEIEHKWQTFAKGGSLSPYYNDLKMVCDWRYDGKSIRSFSDPITGKVKSRPQNTDYFYRAGYSWPLRASRFSPAVLPKGTIFSVRSMSAFVPVNQTGAYIAISCSSVFDSIYKLKLGRFGHPEFQAGIANVLPIPFDNLEQNIGALTGYFQSGYQNSVSPYLHDETSRLFSSCWFEFLGGQGIKNAVENYKIYSKKLTLDVESLQEKVDKISLEIYELEERDLPSERLQNKWHTVTGLPVDLEGNISEFIVKDLLSYLFGKMFGRYKNLQQELVKRAPFSALPVPELHNSKIQITDFKNGIEKLLVKGIAPVGSNFSLNSIEQLSAMLESMSINNESLHEDVLTSLGINELSRYFIKDSGFFDYHLSQYSASSRIAPIYLPLCSSSGNFVIWLFYPKLERSTLFTVLNDVIEPTVISLEQSYAASKAGNKTPQHKIISLLEEIKDFRDQINEVLTGGFNCNIDDGVVLSLAPLRKLFSNSSFREELNNRWAGLELGEYDWSSIALNYWPQRVFNKCRQDRSIAIAHGVENDLWKEVEVPATRGKGTKLEWQPRELTSQEFSSFVQQQIARLKES